MNLKIQHVTAEQRKVDTAAQVRDVAEMYEKAFLRELTSPWDPLFLMVDWSKKIKVNIFRTAGFRICWKNGGAHGGIGLAWYDWKSKLREPSMV